MTIQLVVSMMMLAVLSACSSNPEQGKSSGALNNLPTWAISPTSEAGLADSACVQFSGSINIDRSEAITLASEQLAAQLEKKVSFWRKASSLKPKLPMA